jgi:hypothetical protein
MIAKQAADLLALQNNDKAAEKEAERAAAETAAKTLQSMYRVAIVTRLTEINTIF